MRRAAVVAGLAALAAALVIAAPAQASSGAFERTWGKDVVTGGGTGFEICTAAASCKAGAFGRLGGELFAPSGVAANAGNVYVADAFNHRIQRFDSSGDFWIRLLNGEKLTLTVPGPGEVEVRDAADTSASGASAAAKKKRLKPSSATATGAGEVTVKLKLTKTAKKKLKRKGKVKVNAAITYTPAGGSANTQTAKLKVKKKK